MKKLKVGALFNQTKPGGPLRIIYFNNLSTMPYSFECLNMFSFKSEGGYLTFILLVEAIQSVVQIHTKGLELAFI